MAAPFDPRSPDWPAQAADKVVSVVDTIRDKTTVPLQTAARGVVYGLVAGVMGAAALILLAIAAVRVLDVVLPSSVWLPYLVLGIISSVAGLWAWSKRRRKD